MKITPYRFLFLLACFACSNVMAANWSSANIQLLTGEGYELGPHQRTIITIEHASGWGYGDTFFFTDLTSPWGNATSQYTEFSPRLSLNKIMGTPASTGIVKEYFIASTLEMGNGSNAQLIGPGVSLNIPGFRFVNVNAYARKSHRDWATEGSKQGWQVTTNWQLPFSAGNTQWVFEGFVDYAIGENSGSHPKSNNLLAVPRLLLDISSLWENPGKLMVGLEHQSWRNKFGNSSVDEDVSQAMIKWLF